MDVIANDSAYAGIESESNNVNGSVTLVTNKAYHAGLHLWNRCKNITYKVSATDIVEGGGVITGYGCEACSGYVTAYNAQYIVAYIGNSATTPVISCDAKGSGFNVTDGVVFFATAANNAYIQHCNVDVTVVHADVFSIGTGRQSAVKFNGGQYCDIKVNAKDFDYIFLWEWAPTTNLMSRTTNSTQRFHTRTSARLITSINILIRVVTYTISVQRRVLMSTDRMR